ncbi:MAG: hypothetical protein ACFFER_07205 [Candidatus Thorarchaeota archaeon]
MPTLYSVTNDFLDKLDKQKSFLEALKALKKQLPEDTAGEYVLEAIDQIQELLLESIEEKPAKLRKRIKKLLDKEKFKRGASVIEFSKEDSLDKELRARNVALLSFGNKEKQDLWDLKRYTIDSVKEVPKKIDEKGNEVDEIEIVRVVEAVLEKKNNKKNAEKLTLSDLIDPKSWLEEDREDKEEVVEYHKTREELEELFPTENIPIVEGRVILGNKDRAFDITELVRQYAKESYKKLLKSEGKKKRIGRSAK